MALGKYARVDNRRSASSYCSTVMIVVFVALCLVGVWMMTSSSVVPVENIDIPQENKSDVKPESKNEGKEQVAQPNEGDTRQYEDNPGDLPEDATKGDNNNSSTEVEEKSEERSDEKSKEKTEEKLEDKAEEKIEEKVEEKSEDGSTAKTGDADTKTEDGDSKVENGDSNSEAGGNDEKKSDSDENQNKSDDIDKKSDSDENQNKSDDNDKKTDNDGEEKRENQAEEKLEKNDKTSEDGFGTKSENVKTKNDSSNEVFPSVAQSELLNETTTQNGAWSTQAAESKNEKETQSSSKQQTGYSWKLCNSTAGPDFIPCLDNWKAIRSLHSTKHYEHRERHCPEQGPTCLVPLPDGYKRPVEWPKSREKIWYNNVPHTKLAQLKGHQNWVKVTGKYLTFPGGGTQFKHGALHYIDFIQESVSDIAWGKRSRVILDVGCGVASFGGYLFDRDVLTMSFAPKDEHEAQVQFALERGIPAISAVMGTKRLPFPGIVFDIVHCARCRVPWHIEGGELLLELNRVLRPGGFFVWSATPVYQKLPEDIGIWKAMNVLTKAMCWDLVSVTKDTVNGVGIAIFKKPDSNECYANRPQNEPPMCPDTDDRNAAWNVPLQACMHKVPNNESERGSQWPEQWPARLDNPPYWLLSSQVGVYGKSAPEDFAADYKHWKRVVDKSYLNGMGVNWALVRNVMDMRSVYGGFAAALKDLSVWVMNVVSIDAPDTLPIIYERGLFGMYHDWCESFSSYPRSYDLLHADHLFSKLKSRCNLVAVFTEVDRLLRPEGKLLVRDNVETISELEKMARSLQWEVRMTYSKEKEGLLCVQKSVSRPKELEILKYATL